MSHQYQSVADYYKKKSIPLIKLAPRTIDKPGYRGCYVGLHTFSEWQNYLAITSEPYMELITHSRKCICRGCNKTEYKTERPQIAAPVNLKRGFCRKIFDNFIRDIQMERMKA